MAAPRGKPRLDPHDAQPLAGLIAAIPLGLACWALLVALFLLVQRLIG